MPQPVIGCIAPFFIVRNAAAAVAFYRDLLGFELLFQQPADEPFFAIVIRDGAMIFLKAVGVDPVPNRTRHPWAPWDAYVSVADPDALAAEFTARGVTFSEPLHDNHDGLRGFQLRDADDYALFFGRPRA
jgi:catechol 2,3-dioxygenase-like lactoylglutathione lyase family enzyme